MRSCAALEGLIGFLFCLFGCELFMPVNAHPPASIEEVGAYKAGADGIGVYIVLADAAGQPTTATGTATVCIGEAADGPQDAPRLPRCGLYERVYAIARHDFYQASFGTGPGQYTKLIVALERIPYGQLRARPAGTSGMVTVAFRPQRGPVLSGATTLVW